MKIHMKCLGADIWKITNIGYTPLDPRSTKPLTDNQQKDIENDVKVKEALLSALFDEKLMNAIQLDTTKEIWKKLETLYEGDKLVKIANLEGY